MDDPQRIIQTIEVLRRQLAGFEAGRYSAAGCARLAEELAVAEKACAAARLMANVKAVTCGAHREAGVSDPARWVARQAGTTTRQAKDALSIAASLDACPATKEALLAGEVSIAQAAEITKAVSEMPGAEAELLEIARSGDLTALRDGARERRLESLSAEQLHDHQVASRHFRHWRDGLGLVCFEGALPPETGIPFVTRVEREAERLWRSAKRGRASEVFERHAADALVNLCAEGSGTAPPSRAELVIVCDLYAWRRGHSHQGEPCHVIGGGPIPVALAKELATDAFLKIVLHDGVDIQKIRHVGRKYTASLRTALDLGPVPAFTGGACVDCNRTFGLQRDHDNPVANTGPTSIANVKARCYPCHAQKTERDRLAGLLGSGARARAAGRAKPPAKRRAPARRAPPATGAP